MLSKSKILAGLQCEKRLYLETHRPELAETSEETEARFRVGHDVGALAQSLHPGGRLIGGDGGLGAALKETSAALRQRGDLTLFEGTFTHGGVLIRADVLERRKGAAHLTEVKSSTTVKDYHFDDVAVQTWVLKGAKVPLDDASVLFIDNTFVYGGDGDYRKIFAKEDVSRDVAPIEPEVPKWAKRFKAMLAGPPPEIETGLHCHSPFDCPFLGHCSKDDPEYPVEILPRGGKLITALRDAGYRDLRMVPRELIKSENHLRVWSASKTGKPELTKGVGAELAKHAYPRYYLDFETAQMAIPIWKGTRPYENLPFQWSCHVERKGGSLEHREHIDLSGAAPMRGFAESLVDAIGEKGPIFMYSNFEKTILTGLSERFKDLKPALSKIIARLVDLQPFASKGYYHPDMMGSWSIKGVIPTIAPELDYRNGLGEIQEGGAAQLAYLEAIHADTAPERRDAIRKDLLAYCERDTLAMVRLAQFLQKHC